MEAPCAKVIAQYHGSGAKAYWLFEPSEPKPDQAPLIVFNHGWGAMDPRIYKAWIDHIVRPGKTFRYTEGGAEGLAREKKAILVLASGGVFTEGPWKAWETKEPYLRLNLSFIGITDVQTVRAQGMKIPALSGRAIPDGEKSIESLNI